jgi:sugar lactone lactonase YvrE
MYYVDTPTRRIDAFDYHQDTGNISNRRTIVALNEAVGDPDGMAIDEDDGLWVAMWGGGTVLRFHDGKLDHRIDVPTPYVTCPAFVGPNLQSLLITTASEPIPNSRGGGDIYIAQTGHTGAPVTTATSRSVFGVSTDDRTSIE